MVASRLRFDTDRDAGRRIPWIPSAAWRPEYPEKAIVDRRSRRRIANPVDTNGRLEDTMVTRVSAHPSHAHASHNDRSARGVGWSPGHRASTRQQAGVDDDLAPLGVPAVVVGAVLLLLGLVASGSLSGWVREYGLLLIAVYTGYMALAAALSGWGTHMIYKRRSGVRGRE
ncbi:hypothetical protein IU450_05685 [Nocardia abscessus]|uniref:hypothetical protein n=1 Tax=Nocardia abscessus TaxID=120957 RepID=UPI001894DAD3|nr:hypothetical protein [Nocardia abscessus]MBF6335371.1 hypothetical protein [Nocardia abscessus]